MDIVFGAVTLEERQAEIARKSNLLSNQAADGGSVSGGGSIGGSFEMEEEKNAAHHVEKSQV